MMRANLFRLVHVKTLASQKRRVLLTARKLLREKAIAIENDIRGPPRNFGLKVGIVGSIKFEKQIFELIALLQSSQRLPFFKEPVSSRTGTPDESP